jgi:hypothetical protein
VVPKKSPPQSRVAPKTLVTHFVYLPHCRAPTGER